MKLEDCELLYRCLRGHNVAVLGGDRALTAEEGEALVAEYLDAYGPRMLPAYVSPEGWQLFAAPKVAEPPAPEPAAPAEAPAAVPAAAPVAAKTTRSRAT